MLPRDITNIVDVAVWIPAPAVTLTAFFKEVLGMISHTVCMLGLIPAAWSNKRQN